MRYFIAASAVTVFGLLAFLLFQSGISEKEMPHDDEQAGLKDQIVIHFSHVVAENTPKGLTAQKFADLVEDKTDGRIKVLVYPNSIMYSDGEELDALKNNEVQMIAPSFSKLQKLEVLDLPFLFRNDEHVRSVFTGPVGKKLLQRVQTSHIKPMALWSNGFKQVTHNKKHLVSPADFKNERIRIQPSSLIQMQYEELGAQPVPISFNDVYQSLEANRIDGQENTVSNFYSKRFYKLQKYMTISNHGILGYAVLMNGSVWKKLSPHDQSILSAAMEEATQWNVQQSQKMNSSQLQELQNSGEMSFYRLSVKQKDDWKKAFKEVYDQAEREIEADLIHAIKVAENGIH
ncbi:DctP family TRAP transporter solute-binding subunit [Fictibacillus aquaticus]|uniref:C4-dicarboxylate ABC transporter n=1 Tax=Fictibacillus aquaticus TaxID=2021314 RepID=A0A235FDM1_9BACL|nr:DctP family TRAP transporter solute-binding subunit [Fictibacillus aquaticus]OYD59456.1 C4-dicarboxylate ABC transporter [Fictibacillus aquaticus]